MTEKTEQPMTFDEMADKAEANFAAAKEAITDAKRITAVDLMNYGSAYALRSFFPRG